MYGLKLDQLKEAMTVIMIFSLRIDSTLFILDTSFPINQRKNIYPKSSKRRDHIKRPSLISKFTDNPLPVLTVISGYQSLYVMPKKLQLGTDRLLKAQGDTFLDLGFVCNKKTCPAMPMANPSVGANQLAIYLVNKNVQGWKFVAGAAFSVNTTQDELNISGQGINLKVNWKYQGGSKVYKLYTLEMTLDPSQKYFGLVGDLLNVSARKLGQMSNNIPSVCKGYNFSTTVKPKTAKKYLTPA